MGIMVLCEELYKIYKTEDLEVVALQGLDLKVEQGEMMAIIGNSGSGKSTLLNMIGGLDRPSAGKLIVNGINLLKATERDLINYRRNQVGFIWQNNARNLIPYLSVMQNVLLPSLLKGKAEVQRARELLEMVGLSDKLQSKLGELSGGELQRVAIAIALINKPGLLLADEPTGNLDTKTAYRIFDVFRELGKSLGITIIIVTHDKAIAKKVDRVVAIRDGKTSSEFIRKKSAPGETEGMYNEKEGEHPEKSHIEYTVIDKAGRIQIPRNLLMDLGIAGKNRVRVEAEGKKIVIMAPDREDLNV